MAGVSNGSVFDFEVDKQTGYLHVISVDNLHQVVYTVVDGNNLSSDQNMIHQEIIPWTNENGSPYFAYPTISVDQNSDPHICLRRIFFGNGEQKVIDVSVYYMTKSDGIWSSPLPIIENINRAYFVQIAVDNENRAHIITSDSPTYVGEIKKFSYHRVVDGQLTSFMDIGTTRSDSRSEICVGENNDIHIVSGLPYKGWQNGKIEYYIVPGGIGNITLVDDIHSPDCYDRNGAPDICADKSGNVHFTYGSRYDTQLNDRPSIRYVKYDGSDIIIDKPITPETGEGALERWLEDQEDSGWGLSSIAVTDNGKEIVVAYLTKAEGDLFTISSNDGGNTWGEPVRMLYVDPWDSGEGRSLHLIRAYQRKVFLMYITPIPTIRVKYKEHTPFAFAGGPYVGGEGSDIQFDASASYDNHAIISYEWDWDNDGSFDELKSDPLATHQWDDDYNGHILLKVHDDEGNTHTNSTTVTVSNIDPTLSITNTDEIFEGRPILFSSDITDPGNDTHDIQWQFHDGNIGTGDTISYTYIQDGIYNVIATVEDDDGGIGSDTLMVTVQNSPPVANAGGPYVGSVNMPVQFFGTASDPGKLDVLTYFWDLDHDTIFEALGAQVESQFSDSGHYTVYLKVEDDKGIFSIDSANVKINLNLPEIQNIKNQTIFEGEQFDVLNLDDHIHHPIQNAEEMRWTISKQNELIASISVDRILTITPPDPDWYGSELLQLSVEDMTLGKDSIDIQFTVMNVNDPPQWIKEIPDISFLEDSSTELRYQILQESTDDCDHSNEDLSFYVLGNKNIISFSDPATNDITFSAPQNWYGIDTIQVVVKDPGELFSKQTILVNVVPVPDQLSEFSLISPGYQKFIENRWPHQINFLWSQSVTVDGDQSEIQYRWVFERMEPLPVVELYSVVLQDTVYQWNPPRSQLTYGVYGWGVTAQNTSGDTVIGQYYNNDRIYFRVTAPFTSISNNTLPERFELHQTYPNPFNPAANIQYALPSQATVQFYIFNISGEVVDQANLGIKEAGYHDWTWDATRFSTGTYFIRIQAGQFHAVRKCVLMK